MEGEACTECGTLDCAGDGGVGVGEGLGADVKTGAVSDLSVTEGDGGAALFDAGSVGTVGTGAGAAAAGGAATMAATTATSTINTTAPSDNLSPKATLISLTTPSADDGTSIVALSLSSDTNESSFLIVSPTFTKISITGMSLKSPMSGTFTSTRFDNQSLLNILFSRAAGMFLVDEIVQLG